MENYLTKMAESGIVVGGAKYHHHRWWYLTVDATVAMLEMLVRALRVSTTFFFSLTSSFIGVVGEIV